MMLRLFASEEIGNIQIAIAEAEEWANWQVKIAETYNDPLTFLKHTLFAFEDLTFVIDRERYYRGTGPITPSPWSYFDMHTRLKQEMMKILVSVKTCLPLLYRSKNRLAASPFAISKEITHTVTRKADFIYASRLLGPIYKLRYKRKKLHYNPDLGNASQHAAAFALFDRLLMKVSSCYKAGDVRHLRTLYGIDLLGGMYEQSDLFNTEPTFISEKAIGVVPSKVIKKLEAVSDLQLKEIYQDTTCSPVVDMAENMSPTELVEWMETLIGATFESGNNTEPARSHEARQPNFQQQRQANAQSWQRLNERQLNRKVADLFERMGYSVDLTPISEGRPFITLLRKGSEMMVLQCEIFKEPTGLSVVSDLYEAMHHARADAAKFVALGGFTEDVYTYVKEKPIEIIDLNGVLKLQDQTVRAEYPRWHTKLTEDYVNLVQRGSKVEINRDKPSIYVLLWEGKDFYIEGPRAGVILGSIPDWITAEAALLFMFQEGLLRENPEQEEGETFEETIASVYGFEGAQRAELERWEKKWRATLAEIKGVELHEGFTVHADPDKPRISVRFPDGMETSMTGRLAVELLRALPYLTSSKDWLELFGRLLAEQELEENSWSQLTDEEQPRRQTREPESRPVSKPPPSTSSRSRDDATSKSYEIGEKSGEVIIACPQCKTKNRLPPNNAGKRLKCGKCASTLPSVFGEEVITVYCRACQRQFSTTVSIRPSPTTAIPCPSCSVLSFTWWKPRA